MTEELNVQGVDVAITDLVPLHERTVNCSVTGGYKKILASIREIGLIEPLCVFKENGHYVILDGFIRFKACRELGVETVPCLMFANKEAYTFNRMVNPLSATQQVRMLHKCLETIDEATVAKVFGMKGIKHKVSAQTISKLHPEIVKALDKDLLTQSSTSELVRVKPERQLEILAEMNRCKDYGLSFVRALILRTPASQRNRDKRGVSPWDKDPAQKKELVAKLEAIEKSYDFFSELYRQYTMDLLRLCIYVRKLVNNERVNAFLEEKTPDIHRRFQGILFETEGNATEETGSPAPEQIAASPAVEQGGLTERNLLTN